MHGSAALLAPVLLDPCISDMHRPRGPSPAARSFLIAAGCLFWLPHLRLECMISIMIIVTNYKKLWCPQAGGLLPPAGPAACVCPPGLRQVCVSGIRPHCSASKVLISTLQACCPSSCTTSTVCEPFDSWCCRELSKQWNMPLVGCDPKGC